MNRTDPPVLIDAPDQISVAAVARALARSGRFVVIGAVVVGALAALHAVTRSTTYSSTAWFKPQAQQSQSQTLAGLASQIGISLPLGNSGMTPQAYADLMVSREVLRPVTESRYSYHDGPKLVSGSLVDLYAPGKGPPAQRREGTIALLAKQVSTTVSKTGAVSVKVTTPHAELSQELAARIVDELDSLNLRTQQGRATPEREFIEQQMGIAEQDLHQAENRLAAFLEANRQFGTPQLQLDRERLNRDVAMRQQLYTTLVEAYQRARIDEVRNMPSITVLEAPEIPYAADSRRIASTTAIGVVFGAILGLFAAFMRDSWSHLRRVIENESGEESLPPDSDHRPNPSSASGEAAGPSVRVYKT